MKICSICLIKSNMVVEQPQMLDVFTGCSPCGSELAKSYKMSDVARQMITISSIDDTIYTVRKCVQCGIENKNVVCNNCIKRMING